MEHPFRCVTKHFALWLGILVFWLLVTRNHHPSWTVAIMATVTLVASFAAAVYLNGMLLIPRFAHRQSWFAYLAFLLGTVAALDLIAVLLIQTIYDHFWRPDPLRYGFWTNMAMDGFGIAVHVLAAMLLIGIMKRIRH